MTGAVLVTGANGLVGSALLASYPREQARVGLVRDRRGGDARGGVVFRIASTWSDDELKRALEGVSSVVHAASVVHRPGATEAEYARFNVDATGRLVAAAKKAGVARLVFVSTIKVYGEEPGGGVIDETTPVVGDSAYGRTKIAAERIVLEAASDAFSTAVLRLCPVFGRGDKSNVRSMIRAIARRRFVLPDGGHNRKSIVHLDTVTEVARAAVDSSVGGVFVVADRETPSMRELADTIASVLGVPSAPSAPSGVVRVAIGAIERAFALAGRTPPFTREQLRKLSEPTVCSPARVERELGVSCHVDLRRALTDEIAWLRETSQL